MMALAIALLLAHLVGDFLLQPASWVKAKQEKKEKSLYLYAHIAVHTIVILVALQFNFKYWLGILVIIISHYFIDLAKLYLNKKVNSRLLFALDQMAHLLIIALVVNAYEPINFTLGQIFTLPFQLFLIAILLNTSVASVLMRLIMQKFKVEESQGKNGSSAIKSDEQSLENAGAFIGVLERLFVFGFILLGYWEGIGFLLAAKSVFRFGDLSRAKDRKLTEYILIGTLLSFGFAIAVGLTYNYILEML